jgi:hypothetical protein
LSTYELDIVQESISSKKAFSTYELDIAQESIVSNDKNMISFRLGDDLGLEEEDKTPLRDSDRIRILAQDSKRKSKRQQAARMIKRFKEGMIMVSKGSIVAIKNDYRDINNARGIIGVVFYALDSGGIKVVSEEGIICQGKQKRDFILPYDRYVLKDEEMPIPKNLRNIREDILNERFDEKSHKRVTLQVAHANIYGRGKTEETSGGRRSCACRCGECGPRCGCFRSGSNCNSSCSCFGNCSHSKEGDTPKKG